MQSSHCGQKTGSLWLIHSASIAQQHDRVLSKHLPFAFDIAGTIEQEYE